MKFWNYNFLLLGVISISCQIILLREFFVVFLGNELSLGIVLSNWLLLSAIGSIVSNKLIKMIHDIKLFLHISIVLVVILLPVGIITIRSLNFITQIPQGEFFPIFSIWIWTLLILLPICTIIGMQFNLACKVFNIFNNNKNIAGSNVYMYETLGSLLASFIISFILIKWLNPIVICLLLILIVILFLYISNKNKALLILAIGIIVITISPSSTLIATSIDKYRWNIINKDFKLIDSNESHYGNLAIIDYAGTKYLYQNTKNTGTFSDTYAIQKLTHISANESIKPARILLINGYLNGYIGELLKYNPQIIDCVELDPSVLLFSKPYIDAKEKNSLKNNAVNLIIDDARHFINNSKNKYNLIVCNIPEPFNANYNRFYTKEYFKNINRLLAPDGIYSFTLPSSGDYFGPEILQINSSIYKTIKQVFKNILIIPGDQAIFLASNNNILIKESNLLADRYIQRNIKSDYFFPEMFQQYLAPERVEFANNEIGNYNKYKINSDYNPISYYLEAFIYNKYTHTSNDYLYFISNITLYHLLIATIIIFIILISFERCLKQNFTSQTIMFCTGFIGMSTSLIIMLCFQNIIGGLYYYLGILIAIFMSGIALGSFIYNKIIYTLNYSNKIFFWLLLLIFIYCISLPFTLYLSSIKESLLLFLLLNLLSGLLTGLGYAFINTKFIKAYDINHNGTIYACDLLGASLGSLIISAFLIPLLGVNQTCYFITIIAALTIIKFSIFNRY